MTRPTLIPLVVLSIWLCCTPAHGIEFITKDRFKSASGGYKDYPFRVLFQKLSQSHGEERKKIRTAIIQRQVFDRKMKQRVDDGTVKYQKSFGIVREINEDQLVFWDAQTKFQRTLFSGLVAIPTLNPDQYPISSFNIRDYAVVVYSLDERLYLLEIGFALGAPENLHLTREGSQNLLQWTRPQKEPKPVGYHVLVNGEMYQSTDAAEIRIPRKEDKADEYAVRAVYSHGPALVESQPSATLFDNVTATELAQARQAEQAYTLLLTSLNPASWESGRKILQENLSVFSKRLDPQPQAVVMGLSRFFADIDAGDQLAGIEPQTEDQLDRSLKSYEAALEKGRHLAPQVEVSFIAEQKIQETRERKNLTASQNQEMLASETLGQIIADLTPSKWTAAQGALLAQKSLLTSHLSGEKLALAKDLIVFFAEIDAGDAMVQSPGAGENELKRAGMFYQRAKQIDHAPDQTRTTLDLIVERKVADVEAKLAKIQAQRQQQLAVDLFQEIIAGLTPQKWMDAKAQLIKQQALLTANLDETRRSAVNGMLKFFSDIDAGDALVRSPAPGAEQMAQAIAIYQNAKHSALAQAPQVNLGFIADMKIDKGQKMVQALEKKAQTSLAEKTLERIILGLTPDGWAEARQVLMDNRTFMLGVLSQADVTKVNRLTDFFASIDAGDALASASSATPEDLQRAGGFYQKAADQANALTDVASVGFIAQLRQSENDKRVADLEAQNRTLLAQQRFERILSDLNPARWSAARDELMAQRDLFGSALAADSKSLFNQLVAFFSEIEKGDGFRALQPSSASLMDKAIAAYQSASAEAKAMSGDVALSFLTQLKIEETQREKDALLAQQSLARADAIYTDILNQMTPSQWTTGRKLMIDNAPLLNTSLDGVKGETIAALERFFSEIEEGDRLVGIRPATRANLDNAAMFFRRAQEKAAALPAPLDVKFLADMRLNEIDAQIAAQEAYERRLAEKAAEQAAQKGQRPTRPANLSPKETIQYAVKDFNTGNYSMALQGFSQVYHKQIRMVDKGGMKRLQGVMGLPDKYRAEILFLVELKKLVAKSSQLDQFGLEDEVMELSGRILEGRGMWGIVPQDRRDKMANRLENIRFENAGG